MAWSKEDAIAAADRRLLERARGPYGASVESLSIEANRPSRMGVYAGGRFRVDAQGQRKSRSSTLDLNEAAEVFVPGRDALQAGREGDFGENAEPYLAVQDTFRTMLMVEVVAVPSAADTLAIKLTYKDPHSSGQAEFAVQTANVTTAPTDTEQEIAYKALDAFLELTDIDGNLLVSSWEEQRERQVQQYWGAGSDAQFSAWVEDPTISGKYTLFVQALAHRQDFAHLDIQQGSGGSDFAVTNVLAKGDEPASIRANKLRDSTYTVATAMSDGDIEEGVYRRDLDAQGVKLRSAQGAGQLYEQSTAHLEGGATDSGQVRFASEVITYGVHRVAVIELTAAHFQNTGAILGEDDDRISLFLPWPDKSYYVEGPVIVKDVFVEMSEGFYDEDGTASQIDLQLDVGYNCPDLAPTASGQPLMSSMNDNRGLFSSLLRGVPVSELPPNNRHGINGIPSGHQWAAATHVLSSNYHHEDQHFLYWDLGDTSRDLSISGQVPRLGPFPVDVIVRGWQICFQHPAGKALKTTLANNEELTFELVVLPPNTVNNPGNWDKLSNYIPTTHPLYSWANSGIIQPDTDIANGGDPPGTIYRNQIGFRLPAGWSLGVSMTYPFTLGLVTANSAFQAMFNVSRHTQKGIALSNSSQTALVSPYITPSKLVATLTRKDKFEMDGDPTFGGSPPSEGLRAALGTHGKGKAYVHVHYWQQQERVASQPEPS